MGAARGLRGAAALWRGVPHEADEVSNLTLSGSGSALTRCVAVRVQGELQPLRGAAGGAAGRRWAGGLGGCEADGRRRAALRADGSGTTLCVRARGWVTLRAGG